MEKDSPLKHLVIRTASVQTPEVGYIIACDLEKEREEIQHAFIFKWSNGTFKTGRRGYDANSLCQVTNPDIGHVDLSGEGYYAMLLRSSKSSGVVFEDSAPLQKERRVASFRSLAAVAGTAYAVGLRGLVYRLDGVKSWTRIDQGLPNSFDIQALHGFGPNDLFAVGRGGSLWQFDGAKWIERSLPTSENLTSVKCAGDGQVYLAGHRGVLIRGRDDTWASIDHRATDDDIWDIEWFGGSIFVSTMHGIYCLKDEQLEPIDFGSDSPKSCYQLSAAEGVMWSNGEFDIMSFDGKRWVRIV